MQRTILVKDVGKVTNNSDFNSWIAKHRITINHVEAQRDQQLLIYAALKRLNKPTVSIQDGDKCNWKATVLMENAFEGLYRNQSVSITTRTHPFQVTTYNILTGGWPWHGLLSPYEMETTGITWEKRRHLVVKALKGSQVVMLNEATNEQKDYLVQQLENMEIGSAKIKRGNYDGSVILYNKTKFQLIKAFSDFIRDDYPQVVVAARLRDSSGQEVVFVSLHLKSGYQDKEERRITEFATAMNKVKTEWDDLYRDDLYRVPMVVAGDLNSDYNQPSSNLVRSYVPTTQSLRNAAADKGIESKPTYYYWHKSTFDYILISQQLQVLEMTTEEAGEKAPNDKQGSDHFPVTATLSVGAVAGGAAAGGAASGEGKSESNFHMKLRF